MQIERVVYPVEVLGPGKRLGIWTIGCQKSCPGCISRELWAPNPGKNMPLSQLIGIAGKIISENKADGITISGGDPLEQPEELLQFITAIQPICDDILIYTGYTLQELRDSWEKDDLDRLTKNISVLIDGRYVDSLNDNASPLIGSTNQFIHFFDESKCHKYEHYCREKGRCVQNIFSGKTLVSIGIPGK